jgi:mono/diheme cytochrome c family protein
MRRVLINVLIVTICTICGCTNEQLQRMVEQRRFSPYSENDFFEDHRAMRTLPPGTVPRENNASRQGQARPPGAEPAALPKPIPLAMLSLGRREFQVTCAACHGLLGDGKSVVAEKMSLRAPPSLHDFADRPDGFFYSVISDGYGLMPAFSEHIAAETRWAVVAYVRALQLSQRARLTDASAQARALLESQ